jgi:hypothetical protein
MPNIWRPYTPTSMDQASACVYRVELVLVHYNRSNTKWKRLIKQTLGRGERGEGRRGGEGRGGGGRDALSPGAVANLGESRRHHSRGQEVVLHLRAAECEVDQEGRHHWNWRQKDRLPLCTSSRWPTRHLVAPAPDGRGSRGGSSSKLVGGKKWFRVVVELLDILVGQHGLGVGWANPRRTQIRFLPANGIWPRWVSRSTRGVDWAWIHVDTCLAKRSLMGSITRAYGISSHGHYFWFSSLYHIPIIILT